MLHDRIYRRPWSRNTVQSMQHCILLFPECYYVVIGKSFQKVRPVVLPHGCNCLVVCMLCTLGGCHWKSAQSHLDKKGHCVLAKMPSVAVLPVSVKFKILGRGNARWISFQNSVSIHVTFCFCTLMSVIYFGTCQHLWAFDFSSQWKSCVSTTHDCNVSFTYTSENNLLFHTQVFLLLWLCSVTQHPQQCVVHPVASLFVHKFQKLYSEQIQ